MNYVVALLLAALLGGTLAVRCGHAKTPAD